MEGLGHFGESRGILSLRDKPLIAAPTSRLAMTAQKWILGFAKIVGDFDPKAQDKRYASKNTPKHNHLKHHNSSSS